MCGYSCTGFINFIFNGNSLTAFTIFSHQIIPPKNDDITLNYFLTNI